MEFVFTLEQGRTGFSHHLIESEGTDGVSVTNDATDLSDGSDSVLTDGEVDDLVRAYDTYSDKVMAAMSGTYRTTSMTSTQ